MSEENRLYYCTDCAEFRSCRNSGNDIVCNACNFIIATFRLREVAESATDDPPGHVFVGEELYIRFIPYRGKEDYE